MSSPCPTGSRPARAADTSCRWSRRCGRSYGFCAIAAISPRIWPPQFPPCQLAKKRFAGNTCPLKQCKQFLIAADLTTIVGRRDYAILLLLARLGLRAGEVVTLQLEDIDWDNGQLTIRSKKGNGWARLPLPSDVGKRSRAISGWTAPAAPAETSSSVRLRPISASRTNPSYRV